MSFLEWLARLINDPNCEPEPFCPFCCCYCDVAYNLEYCSKCPEAKQAWAKYRKEHIMLIITVSFPGSAFSTGRDRRGEPLLYNDEIKDSFDELVSTLEPGDTVSITKQYKDRPNQEAHLIINNDRSVIKSGDLPMFYTIHESPQIEGWRLAADLGQLRSRTRMVTITIYPHENANDVCSEYNAFLDWVMDSNGEHEPFCPFPGEMNSEYCDAAYSCHCTYCPYAKAAWDKYRKEHNI